MAFDLTGYRVIVTGASQGIGRGIALAFARSGAAVSVCARRPGPLAETHAALAAIGPAHSQVCDLADGPAVAAYIDAAAAALGGIDVLVNNASGFGRADTEEGWAAAIGVDLMATMRANWAALPWLRQSPQASYIHITSSTVFKPSVIAPAYAAIKAALTHYTRSQAKTLAAEGIRCNAVAPGSTEAPGHFFENRRLAGDPSYERVRATMPGGRLGTPEEIADVVLFLASPAGRWVTGQTILADGGQHLFDNT
jgi:3-oxoacyl-[acyl-carrier protein] reductase